MMFWYGGGWLWWQVMLMWVGMVAFWGLLIWAVYALVTARNQSDGPDAHGGGERHSDRAVSILDERLARGDIDTAEYRRLRDLIASGDHHARAGTSDDTSAPTGTGSRR